MFDTTNLKPPAIVKDIEMATNDIGFSRASDLLTGALLRTLVASKPGGSILELGTGTGLGTAWLLDGMSNTARLISVDNNVETTKVARRFLGHDTRVTFLVEDGADFIRTSYAQKRSFDVIFADSQPGKFVALEETLAMLNPGGLYVIDDLSFHPGWPEGQAPKVDNLVATLEKRADLRITKINWSTGIIIAAKV
jgi:predicted O-methyltransferase YrrM